MAELTEEQKKEFIPKTELEKVQNESKQAIETMQRQVEEAKTQLLSQEYLEFISNKKMGKDKESEGSKNESGEEVKQLRTQLAELRAAQAEIAAAQELDHVIKSHADFEDYRKDVQKILETSKNDLTIEQAYLMAKGQKEPGKESEEDKEKNKKKESFSNEKPGGIYPPSKDSEKKFKSELDAGIDAANTVLAKYNISGGVI